MLNILKKKNKLGISHILWLSGTKPVFKHYRWIFVMFSNESLLFAMKLTLIYIYIYIFFGIDICMNCFLQDKGCKETCFRFNIFHWNLVCFKSSYCRHMFVINIYSLRIFFLTLMSFCQFVSCQYHCRNERNAAVSKYNGVWIRGGFTIWPLQRVLSPL